MAITFVGVGAAVALSGGATGSLNVGLPTGLEVGDFVLIFCSGRGTGYVFTASGYMEKWTLHHATSGKNTIALLYRYRQLGDATTVTVSWTGGAINATVIMQACAFRGATFDEQGATSSNGDLQNIGPISGITTGHYGKCTIVFGHRSDDWTSVADLTGDGLTWNEIGEPDSTLGSDAGMVWAYAIHSANQVITAKTFTVKGGTTDYGLGVMQSLDEKKDFLSLLFDSLPASNQVHLHCPECGETNHANRYWFNSTLSIGKNYIVIPTHINVETALQCSGSGKTIKLNYTTDQIRLGGIQIRRGDISF